MVDWIKTLLSKEELDIIRGCIDEELGRKHWGWTAGYYIHGLKGYRKGLPGLEYPSDINNVIFIINRTRMNKKKRKIVKKLEACVGMLRSDYD